MQSNKLDTKNVSLIAADKNIWLAGMILAVVLIVIQSLSLFPRNISDDSPFLLRDLNHIAKAIHNSTQVYRLKEIVYIFILVIFSRYLRYFEMHGVRKAIYIIISTNALTLLSSIYEKYAGAFNTPMFWENLTYHNINNAIRYICSIVDMIAYFYIAAVLLKMKSEIMDINLTAIIKHINSLNHYHKEYLFLKKNVNLSKLLEKG